METSFNNYIIKREQPILEKKNATYEYGCIMSVFDIFDWKDRLNEISNSDLYVKKENGDRYGKEENTHCTILYGIHSKDANAQQILMFLQESNPVTIEITGISTFKNAEFDVVKCDVTSPELTELNKYIKKNFPNTQTFKDYKPHLTLAYVKSGKGDKYVKKFDMPQHFQSDIFHYSMAFDDFKQDFYIKSTHSKGETSADFFSNLLKQQV